MQCWGSGSRSAYFWAPGSGPFHFLIMWKPFASGTVFVRCTYSPIARDAPWYRYQKCRAVPEAWRGTRSVARYPKCGAVPKVWRGTPEVWRGTGSVERYQKCGAVPEVERYRKCGAIPEVWRGIGSAGRYRMWGALPEVWRGSGSVTRYRKCGAVPEVSARYRTCLRRPCPPRWQSGQRRSWWRRARCGNCSGWGRHAPPAC